MSTLAGLGAFASTARPQSQTQSELDTPLTTTGGPPGLLKVEPISTPSPMLVQNKAYLVYELLVTNFQTAPVTLDSLVADGGPMGIFRFEGTDTLKSMVDLPARYAASGQELSIEPLKTRLLLFWLPFASQQVPRRLMHTIGYSVSSGSGDRRRMEAVIQPMLIDSKTAPVIIGPPLRGNNWLAANGPSNTSGHRRAFMVADGQMYFPERFAIDFVQLGADGKTYAGDPKDNRSYHGYGADIIAVADGTIVDAKAGMQDNVPGSATGPITMATIGGDYLIEDIGNGAFAFSAHLKTGTLKTYLGASVKRGQVLASLGNTGNSTEPHLHFHIISKPFPLAGRGIPYAFDHFSIVTGHLKQQEEISFVFGTGEPTAVSNSLVLENTLINFPQK
ncbi:MAG TPA: M23 family metallopeptidase [Candidatus Binataceae bacterium]